MFTRTLRGVAAVGALGLLLGACGNGSGDGDNGGNGVPTIELALVAGGDTGPAFKAQVKRFNDSHDDVELKLRTYPSGDAYEQAITGQVAGGRAPDIFQLDLGQKTQEFADAGAIAPLDEVVKSAGIKTDDFAGNLIQAATVDGKLYAVPKDYSTTAIFYHKSMLEQAGVKPPTTWEELRTAAEKLTTKDRYGLGMYPQINYFLAWVQAAGGNFVTDSGVENVVNPGHVKALDFLLTLFNEDKSAGSPQMSGASWDGEMLANKQAAMVFGGTWIPGGVPEEARKDIGVVPFPADAQEGSVLYAAGWAVSAQSEHPEAAAEVIAFLTSDEELLAGHNDGIILIPPKQSALDKLADQSDDPVLAVAQKGATSGIPFGLLAPKAVDAYNAMLEQMVSKPGSRSAEQALEDLAGQLQ